MVEEIKSKPEEQKQPEQKQPKEDLSLWDQARAENERMEKNLKEYKEIVARQEKLEGMKLLGGQADNAPTPDKKMTDAEYREAVLRGDIEQQV